MVTRRWTVGVDFGGTNIKLGLVSARGRVVRGAQYSSSGSSAPAAFLDTVAVAVEALARSVGARPAHLRGVGVGAPGPVDVARGVVHSMVNVPGWRAVPLGRLLQRRLRCPCVVDNDVNLMALGEHRFGAGRGARDIVCLTLGTGVGGGLICGGRLYRGASGAAGELGPMVIRRDGWPCACGGRGCLEAYVGTAAIARMARQAIRQGAEPLRTLARQAGGHITPALVSQAARRGDVKAQAVWVELGRSLGIGLANVANLLNPERIVIGGGIAGAWRFFYPSLVRSLRAQAMAVSAERVRVVRAQLGNYAGIVGAALLVWENC